MSPKRKVFLFLFFSSISSFSQTIPADSIQKNLAGCLAYLAQKQTSETVFGKQYAGEWEAQMGMKTFFFMLGGGGLGNGKPNKYRDSNCFMQSGIHNILSEIYLADTSRKEILPMLKKVFPEILTYSSSDSNGVKFNFWKKLPPQRELSWGKEPDPIPYVRRPTTFKLNVRYINNAANVENDADDTALGNLAIYYHERIFGNSDSLKLIKPVVFDSFLDKNRENRNWYNFLFHGFSNSGAYMTWLGKEANIENWNFLKTVGQNLIFFIPASICYPTPYKPYIPWGTNDVDVVVNANILAYLSKTKAISLSEGSINAQKLIEHHAQRGHWNRMGVYYPNRYHFHFAVARAFAAGDTALRPTLQILLNHLSKTQANDGSYASMKRVNKHDVVQSTTYALLSLLYIREGGIEVPNSLIDKSLGYLLKQKKQENEQIYWKGGVFFSGGTIVRSMLYFTSDAYTTALLALALQKYGGRK